jgi:hypothetical protein
MREHPSIFFLNLQEIPSFPKIRPTFGFNAYLMHTECQRPITVAGWNWAIYKTISRRLRSHRASSQRVLGRKDAKIADS